MDFIIKYNSKIENRFKIEYCYNLELANNEDNTIYIEKLKHLDYIKLKNNFHVQYAVGDVIINKNNFYDLSSCKGLFYLFTFSEQNQILQIKPDDHGLLPIYFLEQDDYFYVSSSFIALVAKLHEKIPNPDFYVELALLYTPLNGTTYYKNIKRLEYGELIEFNRGYFINKMNRFYKYFSESPKSFRTSINDIANTFIDISELYVKQSCAISLTGGFDGRTITGCAHYYNSDFINFSYGRIGSGDVDNPIMISNKLGLDYKLIELEQKYLKSDYNTCVESYLMYSGGINGFQYPQSLYYATKIGIERDIIVTGYLGSEILANAKGGDDEINPQAVLDFLKNGITNNNYVYSLKDVLYQLGIIQNVDEITNTLEKLEAYFSALPKNLTINQRLAVFSFENVYRNTFGVWIYNAMHFAKIRVPFIDNDFFEEISKTQVSQFYRKFLENNSLKRIYGQILYSVILEKVWPELGEINSSKGYSPKDVISIQGRIKIAVKKYLKKNYSSEKYGLDKLSTISGAISFIKKTELHDYDINIDKNKIIKWMNENPIYRSLCFLALSKIESKKLFNL